MLERFILVLCILTIKAPFDLNLALSIQML